MENAADALKIAGELLIGLLLISLFVYVFNQMKNSENARDKDVALQQTIEFNKKFEAFNKTSMYGTDLISVLALAYTTNQNANASLNLNYDGSYNADAENSINIHFKLKTPIKRRIVITEYYKDPETNTNKKTEPNMYTTVLGYSQKGSQNPKIEEKGDIFQANKTYSLADDSTIVKNIKEIVIDGNTTKKSYATRNTSYDKIHKNTVFTIEKVEDLQGFDDLKKCVFTCTKVEYSEVGRINQMYFEQKD